MIRDNYSIGFNWIGLLIFLLPILPNVLYFIFPEQTGIPESRKGHLALEIFMFIFQFLFVAMLILLKGKSNPSIFSPFCGLIILLLIIYYVMSGLCFTGNASSAILLGMAIFPLLYFTIAQIWLNISIVIIPTVVYGVLHIVVSCLNLDILI